MAKSRPLHKGLFTGDADNPRLIGSRCVVCGATTFPGQKSCRRCCSDQTTAIELAPEGTLWSWTIQRFRPKQPYFLADAGGEFVPYGVGYVELTNGLIVEALLTTASPEELQIGMPMRLVLYELDTGDAGGTRTHFAFSPLGTAS